MPVLRGDEAVRKFRHWEKQNRAVDERATIVMMSGNVDERDIRHAMVGLYKLNASLPIA